VSLEQRFQKLPSTKCTPQPNNNNNTLKKKMSLSEKKNYETIEIAGSGFFREEKKSCGK